LRAKEPELVEAFEKVISTELQLKETNDEYADRTGNNVTINREARSHQMRQLVQDGLDRTKKEASIKQGIDDGLQAVYAIRGIMDRAVHAAPEAAVVWATVSLGLDVCESRFRCPRRYEVLLLANIG
jgi:N-terminal domain of NWD NACHT-NTPase